jgi:drug/metabolite transporter (DMT)-like permease
MASGRRSRQHQWEAPVAIPQQQLAQLDASEASAAVRSPVLVHAGLWLAVTAWGGSFVAARLLLNAASPERVALSPTVLAALRFSIASAFFLVPFARAVLRRRVSWGDLVRMAVLGQITYAVYFWLQYTGVQQTNASIASILVVGLIPVTTAFLSQFLGRERLNLVTFAAFLLGIVGVVVMVFQPRLRVREEAGFALGAACLVGNAVAFALYSNLSKRWMRTISPLVMTGGTMISGAFGLVLLSFIAPSSAGWGNVARLDTSQWIALLFLALVCSVAAYFAYNIALTRVPASRAAVYIYFEPVVAVVLGTTLLHERLTGQIILGGLIIAASVALVHVARS